MKATIIKIGNSKGIRIPKNMLEESELGNEVDITLKNGSIIIAPMKGKKIKYNEEYILSLGALSEWNSPEEDAAWAYLQ